MTGLGLRGLKLGQLIEEFMLYVCEGVLTLMLVFFGVFSARCLDFRLTFHRP